MVIDTLLNAIPTFWFNIFKWKCWNRLTTHVGTFWNMSGHVGTCWDMLVTCWEHFWTIMLGHVWTCWDMLERVGTCWNMLEHVRTVILGPFWFIITSLIYFTLINFPLLQSWFFNWRLFKSCILTLSSYKRSSHWSWGQIPQVKLLTATISTAMKRNLTRFQRRFILNDIQLQLNNRLA